MKSELFQNFPEEEPASPSKPGRYWMVTVTFFFERWY
jgi:hypothetical protein